MAQEERYYFFDEESSTIWHTIDKERQPQEMLFLGSSLNPNPKMTASVMVKQLDRRFNYKVKELP
ncbi:hypothetical protein RDp07_gp14 [Roseobacter phage RD-1410Ws-07]|uniref:Uncharacterized protein n=2 Tax=Sanyabayvirus DS1410Ws06 TaxID=2844087 RepID=A0A191VYN6_9CAUD|nr:hypothetical protein HYO98_gp17 [Dinoroseobacter phage DS-1410Ws-06]ANJ20674.1 hypothetical protein DSp06_gp17 [Dinoroseobacter phage DS-1410Ws-06]ANJ20825.1 hypothetical protein RDp07_gp14 [Roseobacter phage RD-1410Ws-07]